MPIYNCKVEHDCFRVTKFDSDMNVESSYLTDGDHCDCPAGVRPRCRHRTMLPLFKASRATNGEAFYDFEREVWIASEVERWDPLIEDLQEQYEENIKAEIALASPEPKPIPPKSDLRRI